MFKDYVRLQKIFSKSGIMSRRTTESMINSKRITVNGNLVSKLSTRINLNITELYLDGSKIIISNKSQIYFVINKPYGMLSTMLDKHSRSCIGDVVNYKIKENKKLFHIGRLDIKTQGLLILTNDGELAHRVMHPSFKILKTYIVFVLGKFTYDIENKLIKGIKLHDGIVYVDNFEVLDTIANKTLIKITIHEGRNRIIRRMLSYLNFMVQKLVRISIDSIRLGSQKSNSIRILRNKEINALYQATGI